MTPSFADLLAGLRAAPEPVLARDGALHGRLFADRVDRLADALGADAVPRVASRLDNGPDWLALDLAIRLRRGVHVPLPTFFSAMQIAHALRTSGATRLVLPADAPPPADVDPHALQALAPGLAQIALDAGIVPLPAGTACITYTSGTTGQPKGVCLDAATMLTVAGSLVDASRPLAPARHLCLMPLSTLLENVAGLYGALLADAQIALPSLAEIGYSGAAGLDVATLVAALHRYRPHSAILVPQLLLALVGAAERGVALPDSLRFLAVGGGRVGQALLSRAAALGLPVYEGYGLTECASVVCLNRPGALRPGSVGRPLAHAAVQVDDVGELHVSGAHHLGYLGDAAPAAGAIATGDLGSIDSDGFVHVTGRRKHVFITAFGRNVSPEWVESELVQHPLIAQAVVCGEARPHNVAVLSLRRDADDAAVRRALAEVNAGLPDYAQVADYVRAEAPFSAADGLLTGNGRPRRDAILRRYGDAIERRYRNADALSHARITA